MAAQGTQDVKGYVKPDIVFTHDPCPDGFSCRIHFENAFSTEKIDYRPWRHGGQHDFTNVQDKCVWIVDACPSMKELTDNLALCKRILCIDHHDSDATTDIEAKSKSLNNVVMKFDRSGIKCGSLMLFEELNPGKAIPAWQVAINKGDTNLIYKRTNEEEAYHAFLTSKDAMSSIQAFRKATETDIKEATSKGFVLIKPYQDEAKQAAQHVEVKEVKCADRTYRAGYVKASCAQSLPYITKEVFLHHKDKLDLVCLQWSNGDVKQISLRSLPNKQVNVSKIAALYGGGGHPLASGVQNKLYLE